MPLKSKDTSIPPKHLALPSPAIMNVQSNTRRVSLSETGSSFQVNVISQYACGTVNSSGLPNPLSWDDPVTEQPKHGTTELWEVWNFSPAPVPGDVNGVN